MMDGFTQVNVLDIPRIYTALAEWAACICFSMFLKPRLKKAGYVIAAGLGLVLQSVFLVVSGDVRIWLWLPCMIGAMALMLVLLLLLNDIDFTAAVYTCVRAFLLAEFMASIEWQLHCFWWPKNDMRWWQQWGLLLVVYSVIFIVFGIVERKYAAKDRRLTVTNKECLRIVLMGAAIFAVSNLSFYYEKTPFSGQYASEIMNIRTLVDALGVVLIFTYHIQRSENEARRELGTMQAMFENQYAQYKMNRDSIEMVNRKYHDLKHLIEVLRVEPDAALREEWLDRLESDIRSYELQNKTGNSVLDTLLTAKMVTCQKHGITMTVVADGKCLSFMDKMDICTIFGNALDNAIEHERTIPEKEKRMVHVKLHTQKQFVLFEMENYCPNPPKFRGGFPVTTKADSENHGYGVKSIQYTVKKYGGRVIVKAEQEWFLLKVLIPLPTEEELGEITNNGK